MDVINGPRPSGKSLRESGVAQGESSPQSNDANGTWRLVIKQNNLAAICWLACW